MDFLKIKTLLTFTLRIHSLMKSWNGKLGIDAQALPTVEYLISFEQYVVASCFVFPVAVGQVGGGRVRDPGSVGGMCKRGGSAGCRTMPISFVLHAFAVGCIRYDPPIVW